MNDPAATGDDSAAEVNRAPRWGLIGIIAGVTVVVAIAATVGIRALIARPAPSLGVTAAADLRPGSCLADPADAATDEVTVVDCGSPHPQQVVGTVDLSIDTQAYTQFSAMSTYADEVCDRFLEYGLLVSDGVDADGYDLMAVAVPSESDYVGGRSEAYCAVQALDGSPLVGDLYRPLP